MLVPMKTIALALAVLATSCAKDAGTFPKYITDLQYERLRDTDKARYEPFFERWSRKSVPGDPDYVKTVIEGFSPEFVEAMNKGWAKFDDHEGNIYRNRFKEELKQAGPTEDPVKK